MIVQLIAGFDMIKKIGRDQRVTIGSPHRQFKTIVLFQSLTDDVNILTSHFVGDRATKKFWQKRSKQSIGIFKRHFALNGPNSRFRIWPI